jgi:hypothetical protein
LRRRAAAAAASSLLVTRSLEWSGRVGSVSSRTAPVAIAGESVASRVTSSPLAAICDHGDIAQLLCGQLRERLLLLLLLLLLLYVLRPLLGRAHDDERVGN